MGNLAKLTLSELFKSSVRNYSNRPALATVDGYAMTYAEMERNVQNISAYLHEHGVIMGDRVAILSENMPNWGIAYFAITTMGAVAVPILPDFHPNEVHHIVRNAQCKAIFVSQRLYEKVENIQSEDLDIIIQLDDLSVIYENDGGNKLKEVIQEGRREFAKIYEKALKRLGRLPEEVEEDSLAAIIYTSGTTGHSKGVMLTHKNLVWDAIACLELQEVTAEDRFLSILPLSHTMESTVGFLVPLLKGASIHYFNRPPAPVLLIAAMKKIHPTMIVAVPLIIEKIYKKRILPELSKNRLFRSLYKFPPTRKKMNQAAGKKLLETFGGEVKFFGVGGAKLARDVELFMREARFPYAVGYGLTETSPLLAGCGPSKTKFRSTGPVLDGITVRIVNPDPLTGEGEIEAKGPNVMKGYYNDPERTKEVFTEDGYFKTGDLGLFDKNNYLYIKGRSKNMVLGPSGENIYPEEIESIMSELDFVLESLVYEVNGKLIARVHLDYERLDARATHHNYSESQIARQIEELLAQLKVDINQRVSTFSRINKIIEQTEPFEKTPTQKIKRFLYTQ